MVVPMNQIQEHKRQLVARSEAWRTSIIVEVHAIKVASAWLPKSLHTIRAFSPLLLAIPLLGYRFARRRPAAPQAAAPPKRSFIASVLAGYQFYRQFKPIWDELRTRKG